MKPALRKDQVAILRMLQNTGGILVSKPYRIGAIQIQSPDVVADVRGLVDAKYLAHQNRDGVVGWVITRTGREELAKCPEPEKYRYEFKPDPRFGVVLK